MEVSLLAFIPILLAAFAPVKAAVAEVGGPVALIEDVVDIGSAIKEAHVELQAAHLAASPGGGNVTPEEGEAIAVGFVLTVSSKIAARAGLDTEKEQALARELGLVLLPKVFGHLTGTEWGATPKPESGKLVALPPAEPPSRVTASTLAE